GNALRSILRGFGVANFTNHHDVRILAENGTEGVAEGESNFLLRGYLVDAPDLELHRVFDGDDVVLGVVQLVERRVEGGGLARTGGAGHQEQAVRRIDRGAEPPER